MEIEDLKKKLQEKIAFLNEQLNRINSEIVSLDQQLGRKRGDFIRIQGNIEALQATLNELTYKEEEKVESEKEDG